MVFWSVCVVFFLMILRPQRSHRTNTLSPSTPLVRASDARRFCLRCDGRCIWCTVGSAGVLRRQGRRLDRGRRHDARAVTQCGVRRARAESGRDGRARSEAHTSELQSLMRISYAVFCLKKKKTTHVAPLYDSTYRTSDSTYYLHTVL